jgi:predicted esterase
MPSHSAGARDGCCMRAPVLILAALSFVSLTCARSPGALDRIDETPGSSAPAAAPPAAEEPPAEAPPADETPPPPEPVRPETRQTLVPSSGHIVEVYPPIDAPAQAAVPLVVFLHATCMQPADVCEFWSKAGREGSWLACPAGPSTCYGEPDWSGTPKEKAAALDSALTAVDGAYGRWIDHGKGDVLIGYSRGAFAARDILYERPGRFHGLILISAILSPDPARLKAAGIRRAVFATGDLDISRPTMRLAVQKLDAAGIPARFMSLGKVGHWLPEDLERIMRDALAWVEAPGS